MKLLKLGGVQGSDGVRHARSFADSMRVDGSHSEVVGVSFEQAGHWVFTDLNGVIVALGPVLSSDFTPIAREHDGRIMKGWKNNNSEVATLCPDAESFRSCFGVEFQTVTFNPTNPVSCRHKPVRVESEDQ